MTLPWTEISNSWSHPWHSMCSYLGTFPPPLARSIIELLTEKGDIVYDPFSGRGTTLLESRLAYRLGICSDLNPIAVALSKAKASDVTKDLLLERIAELREGYEQFIYMPEAETQSDEIKLIFSPRTLAQLCYLRGELTRSNEDLDQFILGALLGVMHGSEKKDGSSIYASISMPNTFSMSPGYVRRFVETKRLNRTSRDVFSLLDQKIERLFKAPFPIPSEEAVAEVADAKSPLDNVVLSKYRGKVKLVLSSPPYLGVVNYAKQNWIRNWLLEKAPEFHRHQELDDDLNIEKWLNFAEQFISGMREMISDDGVIALVVGDVAKKSGGYISLARELIRRLHFRNEFKYIGCLVDNINVGYKTTKIWKETKGSATSIDRIVFLSNSTPNFNHSSLKEVFSSSKTDYIEFNADDLERFAKDFSQSASCSI